VLLCVDEPYIRKIAVEANEMVAMGMKLPTSLVSTAPEEFHPPVPTGKLSKTQKKKLKKKAKLQNELIKLQMEHLQQTAEQDENKGTKEGGADGEHLSATATLSNNDESPTDNETSSHILNGSMKSNASSENENEEKEKNNMSTSVKSNEESNEDNEDIDESVKMSNSSPPSECVIDDDSKVAPSPPVENGTTEHSKRSSPQADPTFEVCDFEVKIADLGNACWVDKHFTEGE
jgi:serine/threonine-protein kinase SRPK1